MYESRLPSVQLVHFECVVLNSFMNCCVDVLESDCGINCNFGVLRQYRVRIHIPTVLHISAPTTKIRDFVTWMIRQCFSDIGCHQEMSRKDLTCTGPSHLSRFSTHPPSSKPRLWLFECDENKLTWYIPAAHSCYNRKGSLMDSISRLFCWRGFPLH